MEYGEVNISVWIKKLEGKGCEYLITFSSPCVGVVWTHFKKNVGAFGFLFCLKYFFFGLITIVLTRNNDMLQEQREESSWRLKATTNPQQRRLEFLLFL